jgi:hypothetical protein
MLFVGDNVGVTFADGVALRAIRIEGAFDGNMEVVILTEGMVGRSVAVGLGEIEFGEIEDALVGISMLISHSVMISTMAISSSSMKSRDFFSC